MALIKGDKKDAIRKGGILVICRIAENRYNAPVGANGSLAYSVFGNLYEIFKIARYAIRRIKERT